MMMDQLTRPQAIEVARRMWANGQAWTLSDISRYLTKRGVKVSRQTVRGWVNEDYRRLDLERNRSRKREQRGTQYFRIVDDDAKKRMSLMPSALTPDVMLAMRVEDGLSYMAIAAVARRFFGQDMSEYQVRARLYELGVSKNPKRVIAAERQAA